MILITTGKQVKEHLEGIIVFIENSKNSTADGLLILLMTHSRFHYFPSRHEG